MKGQQRPLGGPPRYRGGWVAHLRTVTKTRAGLPAAERGRGPAKTELPDLSDDGGTWEPAPVWVETAIVALGIAVLALTGCGVWAAGRWAMGPG